MNRTLSLIPSRHAARPPAPPPSRHVVGVKSWGVGEKLGLKSATIHPLRRWVLLPSPSRQYRGALTRAPAHYCSHGGPKRVKMGVLCGLSDWLSFSPPSSRCVGLPLQTAYGPLLASASRDLWGCEVGRQVGTRRYVINCKFTVIEAASVGKAELGSFVLATGSPGLSLCQEAVLLLVDTGSERTTADPRLERVAWMHGNEPCPNITATTCVRKLLHPTALFVLMCHVCLDKNVWSVSETPNVVSC